MSGHISRRSILRGLGGAGLIGVVAAVAAACGDAGGGAGSKPAEKAAEKGATSSGATAAKPAAGSGPTTIAFSHYLDPAAAKVYEAIIGKEFKEKYPNYDVKIDISPEAEFTGKMLTQMGGGNFSDTLMVTDRYVPDFASRDTLVDMNPMIKADDSKFDFKDINEDLAQSGNWDGKQVAIFDYTGPIVIYYNKRLFREAGVEPPKDNGASWTYEQFIDAARKLTRGEGEKRVWGFEGYGPSFGFQTYIYQSFGAPIVDHRGPVPGEKVNWHWNTAEGRKVMQMQTDWVLKDKIFPQPGQVQGNAFQAQRVAMQVVAGRWLAPLYSSFDWSNDIGMLHQPLGTAPRQSRNGPRGLMIPKGSKNQEAAWNFIKFITDKDGMQLIFRANYSTPARKSLWEPFGKVVNKWEDATIYRTSQDAMAKLGALPTYPQFAKVNKILTDNISALWLGQVTSVEETLKKIDAESMSVMKQP